MNKIMFAIVGALMGVQTIAIEFDPNVDQGLRAQVLDDLGSLSVIREKSVSPLHQKIFGPLDGARYTTWFYSRVKRFGVSQCGSSNAVACVREDYPAKIWVTRNYIELDHPQISRVMTLFHEARHAENPKWKHALCPPWFRQKSIWTGAKLNLHYACDKTPLGSYGAASIMLNNISRFCSTCNEKVRMDAKIYSDDQAKRVNRLRARHVIVKDFKASI